MATMTCTVRYLLGEIVLIIPSIVLFPQLDLEASRPRYDHVCGGGPPTCYTQKHTSACRFPMQTTCCVAEGGM